MDLSLEISDPVYGRLRLCHFWAELKGVLYKPGEWASVVLAPRRGIWCLVYLIHYRTFAVLLLASSECLQLALS